MDIVANKYRYKTAENMYLLSITQMHK